MTVIIFKCVVIALFVYSCGAQKNTTVRQRYYPRFHLGPPLGWMNDPNGFSKFKGWYHLFYQYNPLSSLEPGIAHWGHARSLDLFHWEHLPIALFPEECYDKDGVFSGSAFIEDGKMYLYYTGNVKKPAHQQQALAVSTDGIHIKKYEGNPILLGEGHQPHIRDPQVWKHEDTYYMVLGSSFNTTDGTTLGRVLLYASKDKLNWKQVSVIDESDGYLGYMWECPTFFKLGKYYVLLFSPQGVEPEGDMFRNLYQTGYFIGFFDYDTLMFTPITFFREIDNGHDFYATQIIIDEDENVKVIGWFDMWERDYLERYDGFTGCMTIPRKLSLGPNGVIYQNPVDEISNAIGKNLYSGKCRGCTVELPDKTAEIIITAPHYEDLELYIESDNQTLTLSYNYMRGKVTLDRGGEDGVRRTKWRPRGKLHWRIFVDASSVELFCGKGENTFSSRFFPSDPVRVRLGNQNNVEEFVVNAMKRTVPIPDN